MKDRVGIDFPALPLLTLTIVGTGFVITYFLLLSFGSLNEMHLAVQSPELRNFGLEAQLVAMVFWTALIILGGIVWTRAFFRSVPFLDLFVASIALGLFLIAIVIATSSVLLQNGGTLDQVNEIALSLVGLLFFILLGLMVLIAREVVAAMFS